MWVKIVEAALSTPHPQAQTSLATDYYVLSLRIVSLLETGAEVHGVTSMVGSARGS